ncbi:MAG TPA: hypothetical protein VGC18_03570 [Lacisediminihabitans sp.]|uniref:hypothetical protein n=1 Tax=Lacisediminihabitans sp. TaxID=2787631 RepID=UPI002ED889EF
MACGLDGFTYDQDGYLVEQTRDAATSELSWNACGELQSIVGTTTADFRYDTFGRRIDKTIDGAATALVSVGANLAKETDNTATSSTLLSGGTDEWSARTTSGSTVSYLTDALGSPVALGAPDGQLTTQYSYDPYGVRTEDGSISHDSIGFTTDARWK